MQLCGLRARAPVVRIHRRAISALKAADATREVAPPAPAQQLRGGRSTVEAFYEAYNRRDLDTIEGLIAEDIVYSDLVYPEPKRGRGAVMAWLAKVRQYAPDDLVFVIEGITDGDASKVGVQWHVEVGEGVHFPFSRGCSFIQLDAEGRIAAVRDVVESSMKPGDSTLVLLGALAPLIRAVKPPAPGAGAALPAAALGLWALYFGYMGVVMLSDLPPGPPAIATPPEVLLEVFNESLNIFWVNPVLTQLHLSFVPCVPSPPVSEALFNFVLSYCAMFLPLIWSDPRSQGISNKRAWATGIAFLTNVFFIPFMALRAAAGPASPGSSSSGASAPPPPVLPGQQQLPGWSRATGAFGLLMGGVAIAWALYGRPELGGDLATRWQYFQDTAGSNRVFWAFLLDLGLFYGWQVMFLEAAPARYRWLPFVGLGGFLLAGGSGSSSPGGSEGGAAAAGRS